MEAKSLKQIILNEIDNRPRGFAEILASECGYSSGSALKKVLRDEKKEFERFQSLLNIIQTLFTDSKTRHQVMMEYAKTIDVKKQTARYMVEYSEIHALTEMKEDLINRMLNCGNSSSEEWAAIYQTEMLFQQKTIGLGEAVARFSSINPKQPEIRVGIEIYKSYCYLVEQQYDMIYHSLLPVGSYIEEIKEPYIKNMFQGRYLLLMIEEFIRKDNLQKARELCEDLLNNSMDMYKCHAYMHLGNSYMVESFDKSYEYLTKGIKISHNRFRGIDKQLKRSMNFLCNLWNVDAKYLDLQSSDSSDRHEIAFYYIRKGQITEAEKTLSKVNLDEISFNSRGFHFYIRGLLTNNIDFYAESIMNFKLSGDLYFRKLPLLELKKLNIPDSIIKALTM